MANVIASQSASSTQRRRQVRLRILVGASALLFAIGVIAFIQSRTSTGPSPTKASPAELKNQSATKVTTKPGGKLTAAEQHVASRFITTALGRNHLAEAWTLATPELRGGVTRKQWLAGEMPIPPYPVRGLQASGYQVEASAPNKVLVQVFLVPKAGTGYRPLRWDMTLVKSAGTWKVSYLVPYAPQGMFSANTG